MRSYGYVQTDEPDYMLTVVDRGAGALVAEGLIGEDLADAFRNEARRRVAAGSFFGHIAYASLTAEGQPAQIHWSLHRSAEHPRPSSPPPCATTPGAFGPSSGRPSLPKRNRFGAGRGSPGYGCATTSRRMASASHSSNRAGGQSRSTTS